MRDFEGCCSSGAPGAGDYEPQGQVVKFNEVSVYDSQVPSGTEPQQATVLLLPDGFGHAKHNYILADRFAKSGYRTLLPDYFEGDGLPVLLLHRNHKLSIDEHDWSEQDKKKLKALNIGEWTKRHPQLRIEELLTSVIDWFRKENPSRSLFGVGYCFGGKYVYRLAKSTLKAAVAFHPSFVTEDDFESIEVPTYVGLAEKDQMVPDTLPQDLKTWSSKNNVNLQIEMYPGMNHGFAARPEAKDPGEKAQYDLAYSRTVEFFATHQ